MKRPNCAKFTSKSLKERIYDSYAISRFKRPECGEFINLYESEGIKGFAIQKESNESGIYVIPSPMGIGQPRNLINKREGSN